METKFKRKTKLLAIAGLLITTMIWGGAFVVMKNSVDVIPPTWLLAVRFTIAAVGLALVFHRRLAGLDRSTFTRGLILGFILETAYLLQTYGLKYTTASKNAFITTLYVVIVPFLNWAINRRRPGFSHIAAALLAIVGLALLSLQGDLSIQLGDFLTLLCGIAFAFQMTFISRFTKDRDPIVLTVLQIASAAVFSWILAPFLDGAFDFTVLLDTSLILGLLYLGLFSTMLCFLLQNVGQKFLNANAASVLLSTESVFGTLFSVIFLKEVLTGRMIIGCVLMFAAVLLAQLTPRGAGKEENG